MGLLYSDFLLYFNPEQRRRELSDQRHFVTGSFASHASYLSDDLYSIVLDNIVVTCVDCVILHQGKMLLGKRTREPQPDWWVIGGRMLPGESFIDAAIRNSHRELSIELTAARFDYLGAYSFVWEKRAQPPVENGCHMVSVVMVVRISEEEVGEIQTNDEYNELRWVYPKSVVQSKLYHPALVQIAKDLPLMSGI